MFTKRHTTEWDASVSNSQNQMKIVSQFLSILTVILAVGCSTPYQPASSSIPGHGYSDSPLGTDRFKINFTYSSSTASELSDYLLLRAGEVTLQNGFKYFIEQSNDLRVVGSIVIKCFKTKPEGSDPYDAEVVVKSLKAKYKLK